MNAVSVAAGRCSRSISTAQNASIGSPVTDGSSVLHDLSMMESMTRSSIENSWLRGHVIRHALDSRHPERTTARGF